jgi:hypothetical protein
MKNTHLIWPFVFVGLMLQVTVLSAQSPRFRWEENRKRYALSAEEEAMNEVIVKHHLQYDYEVENDQLVMFSTLHRIVRLNSNEAIQRNNRIYISMNRTFEIVDLKARAISKEGKATVVDKTSLRQIKDDEASDSYQIFAMDGLEIGSEIEYFYTKKMSGSAFDRVYMQFDAPLRQGSFQLSSPGHLNWELKGYNGCPVATITKADDRNIYSVSLQNQAEQKKEDFASQNPNRARVEFKLAYNAARSNARMYTWEDAAKRLYSNVSTRSKEEDKAVEKWFKGVSVSGDEPSRISQLEGLIKATIQVSDQRVEQTNDISLILKNRIASKFGIVRLLWAVYQTAGIDAELVVTCSRENVRFDKDFDTWGFLDQYLIYFPKSRQFLFPSAFDMRYPIVPAEYTEQFGLFIQAVEVAGVKSALGSVQWIPAAPYTASMDNLNIQVTFNPGNTSNSIILTRELTGYNAAFVSPYLEAMTNEQKEELVRNIARQTAPDVTLTKYNIDVVKGNNHRFVMQVEFSSDHFIELAGRSLLFNIGELIGPQVEMYRQEDRLYDIENDFNRGYDRVIQVTLPEGYKVKNPESMKMSYSFDNTADSPFLFQSDYVLSERKLELNIKEYYKNIFVPVQRYEDFRKIINAAADFNKIVLVLEPVKP